MTVARYPEYRPSGLDWLDEVPQEWDLVRLKYLLAEVDSRAGERNAELLGLSKAKGVVKRDQLEQGAAESDDYGKYKLVRSGELVMNKMQAWNGVFGIAPWPGMVSPDYAVFRFTRPGYDRYLCELFRTGRMAGVFFTKSRGMGTAFLRLNTRDLLDIKVPIPPIGEAQGIAAHLMRETATIDELIAEQQRLIELLNEKRRAVISQAVTRGLNPRVPMKPSGIEWIRDIPSHWDVSKMKWVARMESGHTPDKKVPEYWEGGDIPWVSLNDTGYLKDHDYISETAYSVTALGIANSSAHLLPARAVVFSRDATIGRCAITARPMAVSQHFIAWICGESILPEYLLLRLRSMAFELDILTTGATIKTIGMPEVRTLVTPVPPVEEQRSIVASVARETGALDALAADAQRAIDLLHERRAALISAAVTGQIDVRGLADSEAA